MTHSITTPYDSEMAAAYALTDRLTEKYRGARVNPQDVVEQFAKIGLVVDVKTFSTGNVVGHHPITGEEMVEEVPGLWSFDVTLLSRVDKHEFDHDRMAHEVQGNILGLRNDGPGQIHAPANLDDVVKKYTKGHSH
jgi:hypothetical protein